jgi:hypothetical protein
VTGDGELRMSACWFLPEPVFEMTEDGLYTASVPVADLRGVLAGAAVVAGDAVGAGAAGALGADVVDAGAFPLEAALEAGDALLVEPHAVSARARSDAETAYVTARRVTVVVFMIDLLVRCRRTLEENRAGRAHRSLRQDRSSPRSCVLHRRRLRRCL